MDLYIDCEWNDWRGKLISMALVCKDGREWYEVVDCQNPSPWVAIHVMPILNKRPVSTMQMRDSLHRFLRQFQKVTIIADWPEDIAHFCNAIVFEPGGRLNTPDLHFHCRRDLEGKSALPHNALEDARALMREAIRTESTTA